MKTKNFVKKKSNVGNDSKYLFRAFKSIKINERNKKIGSAQKMQKSPVVAGSLCFASSPEEMHHAVGLLSRELGQIGERGEEKKFITSLTFIYHQIF